MLKSVNMRTFTRLLVAWYEREGKVPHIRIPENTTLSVVLDMFQGNTVTAETTGVQAVRNCIAEFEAMIGDDLMYNNGINTLDQMTDIFADRIKIAFSDLATVRDLVEDKTKFIQVEIDRKLSADPFLNQHYGKDLSGVEPRFSSIDWDPIFVAGSEKETVLAINSRVQAFKDNDATSQVVLSAATRQIQHKLNQDYKSIDITKETSDRLIEVVVEKTKQSSDVIRPLMRVLTDRYTGVNKLNYLLQQASSVQNAMTSCTDFLSRMETMKETAEIIRKEELSNATKSLLDINLGVLDEVLTMMAYYVIHCRRVLFSESIMLPSGQINPDLKDDYTQAGGTMTTLAHYVKYFFNNEETLRTSARGVSLNAVLNSKERIAERAANDMRNIAMRVKSDGNAVIRDTFRIIMRKFVEEQGEDDGTFELKVPIEHSWDMIDRAADRLINGTSIEDVLYDIIFKAYYCDSFVTVLYKRLGVEFTKMLATHKNISQKNLRLLEKRVLTDMVSEFIFNTSMLVLEDDKKKE